MDKNITVAISVYGKVQGVGFRPLVCRLANRYGLTGFVKNAGTHVEIIATGTAEQIEALCGSLKQASRPVRVEEITCKEIALQSFATFVSVASAEANEVRCVSADIGICEDCLRELDETRNRRNGYAYISCARCGPRYTIIRKLPYDRVNTTMDAYALCDACAAEYSNMEDRRGHGETISCYHCGPQLQCFVKKVWPEPGETVFALHNGKKFSAADDRKINSPIATCYCAGSKKINFKKFLDKNKTAATVPDKTIIALARRLLHENQIVMVKAVGGFNLLCRADRSEPVTRLRDLKKRMSKPFAVMVKRAEDAARFCYISQAEQALLESEARPIVLLQKKDTADFLLAKDKGNTTEEPKENYGSASHNQFGSDTHQGCDATGRIAANVTDVSDQIGVMLPSMGFYAALDVLFPIVVTSCNYAGEPILYKDDEAFQFFETHDVVAALFTYDREILRPADDAVARVILDKPQLLRRTKGYMPEAVAPEAEKECAGTPLHWQNRFHVQPLADSVTSHRDAARFRTNAKILAAGAEMKPGFCLTADGKFFPAEIPGDITLERTEQFFAESVQDWMQLLNIRPEAVVADLHPGYATTQWGKQFAEQNGLPFYQAQHHHAHALSVMAEHSLQGGTLAVCFDGTGFGDDGTVWGGEFLLCEGAAYQRIGHLKPVSLLGGDASMQQAWKTALCHLAAVGLASPDPRCAVVQAALKQKINCIETSSMGRLFDAAASILGLADFNSHEGRCAMALEAAARQALLHKIAPLRLAFRKEEKTAALHHKNFITEKNSLASLTEKSVADKVKYVADANKAEKVFVYNAASLWETFCDKSLADDSEKKLCEALRDANKSATGEKIKNDFVCSAALGFHYAVCDIVVDMAETAGVRQVVLAGGCFANRILLETCTNELRKRGFLVYYNEKVSPGDGGIAVGQAYYGWLKGNGSGL